MNLSQLTPKIKYLTLSAGLLALLLQALLYATGVDEKGLLTAGHPAGVAIWVLTAVMAAVLFFTTRSIQGPTEYRECFPASAGGAIGAFLAALGTLITAVRDLTNHGIANTLIGLVSCAALIVIGWCRLTERKPHFLLHALVSVCFALRLMALYQTWSFEPQLHDYCFKLFACIGLAMTGYQLAVFDLGKGSHWKLWLVALASVFLCCLSLRGGDAMFFLTGGCFAFTSLTNLKARRRIRPRLILDDTPSEQED